MPTASLGALRPFTVCLHSLFRLANHLLPSHPGSVTRASGSPSGLARAAGFAPRGSGAGLWEEPAQCYRVLPFPRAFPVLSLALSLLTKTSSQQARANGWRPSLFLKFLFACLFLRWGFSVAMEPVLELAVYTGLASNSQAISHPPFPEPDTCSGLYHLGLVFSLLLRPASLSLSAVLPSLSRDAAVHILGSEHSTKRVLWQVEGTSLVA